MTEGANIVHLDPEIAAAFPTSRAVNDALAKILKATRSKSLSPRPNPRPRQKPPPADGR